MAGKPLAGEHIRQRIDVLLEQADHMGNDDPVAARETLAQIAAMLAEYDYPAGRSRYLVLDGIVAFYEGNFSRALESLNEADQLADAIPRVLHTRALNMLAATYRQIGDLSRASEVYHRLWSLCAAVDDQAGVVHALNGLAGVYSYRNDDQAAVTYLEQALVIARAAGNSFAEGMLLGNCARCYRALGDPDKAIMCGEASINILTSLGKQARSVHAFLYTAAAYQQLDQYGRAVSYLEQAVELARKFGMRDNQLESMYLLADARQAMGEQEAALDLLHSVIEQAGDEHVVSRFESYGRLYQVYKARRDYEKALFYLEQQQILREQIYSTESAERMQNLEIQHRTQQALQEAAFYRQRTREIEALREQDRRYAEQLNQIKDDFISTTSHDLKNPLTRIVLNLHMLERHGNLHDARGRMLVERIHMAIDLMKSMLTDMLDIVRLETGRALHIEPTSISAMMHDVAVAFETAAEAGSVTLTCETPGELNFPCDPVLMRSAVDNLVSNAIKYTPSGGEVRVKAEVTDSALRIEVRDTGYGINDEELPHIFERFYRSAKQPDPAIEGTGLGLAIVKLIVESHGGYVTVTSEPGAGSCFKLTLPAQQTDAGLSNS